MIIQLLTRIQKVTMSSSASSSTCTFSVDLLKCPQCGNIPLKYTMAFCENGHMVCGTCRKQVKNSQCPTCPATFVSRRNTFIEHLLDSIELMNCKYKNLGCPRTLIIKDKDFHENACEYRLVDCFHKDCMASNNQYSLKNIKEHYENEHGDPSFQEKEMDNLEEECEINCNLATFRKDGNLIIAFQFFFS